MSFIKKIPSITNLQHEITDLAPGTEYDFSVVAVRDGRKSEESNIITETPRRIQPYPPSVLTLHDVLTLDTPVFETDFSEYTTDAAPTGWTDQWYDTEPSFIVKTSLNGVNPIFGSKFLVGNPAATVTAERFFTPPGAATETDGETLSLIRFSSLANAGITIHLRTPSVDNQARVNFKTWNNFYSYEFDGDTAYNVTISDGPTIQTDTWFWVRFRAEGTKFYFKIWVYGEPEPISWHMGRGDLGITDGLYGLGYWSYNLDQYVDYFAFSDGPTIPVPEVV